MAGKDDKNEDLDELTKPEEGTEDEETSDDDSDDEETEEETDDDDEEQSDEDEEESADDDKSGGKKDDLPSDEALLKLQIDALREREASWKAKHDRLAGEFGTLKQRLARLERSDRSEDDEDELDDEDQDRRGKKRGRANGTGVDGDLRKDLELYKRDRAAQVMESALDEFGRVYPDAAKHQEEMAAYLKANPTSAMEMAKAGDFRGARREALAAFKDAYLHVIETKKAERVKRNEAEQERDRKRKRIQVPAGAGQGAGVRRGKRKEFADMTLDEMRAEYRRQGRPGF